MKTMSWRLLQVVGLVGLSVILGQNCSPSFMVDSNFFSNSSSSVVNPEFLAAKSVLDSKCVSCHTQGGSGGVTLDFPNEQGYLLSGQVIAGDPDRSKLIQRLKNYTGSGDVSSRNMPPTGTLTDAEYETLRRWVRGAGASADTAPFQCLASSVNDKAAVKTAKVLSQTQYLNTLRDFLKLTNPSRADAIYNIATADTFFGGQVDTRFPRNSAQLNDLNLAAFFKVADLIGSELVKPASRLEFVRTVIALKPGSCVNPDPEALSAMCATQLVRNLGLRLLRRPVIETGADAELEAYRLEIANAENSPEGVGSAIVRMLMSPSFLFVLEDHETEVAGNPKLLSLSSYSIATRLSYAYWNSMPDEFLLSMASNNNLQDDAKFNEALTYVLSSPRVEDSLKEFAQGWLMLGKAFNFEQNSIGVRNYNEGITFDGAMRTAMVDEQKDLFTYLVRNSGTFQDLFTSDVSVTRYAPLMQVYGVSQPAPAVITPMNAVRMPAGTRAGVLTRAALLAEQNGNQHLIHRAIRIRRDLLCLSTPAAPADTSAPVPLTEEQIQSYTSRQRWEHNTGSGNCYSCHQTINPFGTALSNYNGLGFYKTTEPAVRGTGELLGTNLTVNSFSDLRGVLSGAGEVRDGVDYSNFLGQRMEAQSCFAQKASEYVFSQAPDLAKEGCKLNRVTTILRRGGTVKESLSSLVTDREFRMRRLDE